MDTAKLHFSVPDWVVFAFMLVASAGIGIFYMIKDLIQSKNRADATESLTSKESLPIIIVLSLINSYVSSVTILGTPAEIYFFGSQYCVMLIPIFVSGIFIYFVHVPLFYELQLLSVYEYLELRFDKSLNRLATVFFIIDELLFLPIVIFMPSVALNQVTGINLYVISTIVTLICVAYTMMGGLQAIFWADTLQMIIMIAGIIGVMIAVTLQFDSAQEILDITNDNGRMIFDNFSPSPFEKHTWFSVVLGGSCYWMCFNSCHQTVVQKYVAASTLRKAKVSFAGYTIGVALIFFLCCYMGFMVTAVYGGCDPSHTKRILEFDQILPLLVMDKTEHIFGLPGLFIAGVFGAAIGSLAILLNSTTLVIYEFFIKKRMTEHTEQKFGFFICKSITLLLGVIAICSIFLVEQMQGILTLAVSVTSIIPSVVSGMFLLGMLFPWANTKGAFWGAIAGSLVAATMSLGQATMQRLGYFRWKSLPIRIDECGEPWNTTNRMMSRQTQQEIERYVFPLFKLSIHLVSPIGFFTVLLVGLIVSFSTKRKDLSTLDPRLIAHMSRWILKKSDAELDTNGK